MLIFCRFTTACHLQWTSAIRCQLMRWDVAASCSLVA